MLDPETLTNQSRGKKIRHFLDVKTSKDVLAGTQAQSSSMNLSMSSMNLKKNSVIGPLYGWPFILNLFADTNIVFKGN